MPAEAGHEYALEALNVRVSIFDQRP